MPFIAGREVIPSVRLNLVGRDRHPYLPEPSSRVQVLQRPQTRAEKRMESVQRVKLAGYEFVISGLDGMVSPTIQIGRIQKWSRPPHRRI
jgi:hypothetical protein